MSLDVNGEGTYKNIIATTEVEMLSFVKDGMAMLVLAGFTAGLLSWMDIASRLVV